MLALLFALHSAYAAVTLPPVANGNDPKLPISSGQTPIACDQIANALTQFQQMEQQHENSLTAFLGDVGTKVSDWYTQLSPLEGTNQTLPAGTFSVLQDGGSKITNITNMAYDNSDLLAQQLGLIITSLQGCTISGPTLKSK